MKKTTLISVLLSLLFIFVLAPLTSLAQQTPPGTVTSLSGDACSTLKSNGLQGVANCLLSFFGYAEVLMIAAAVVYTIYGAFQMVQSEEKRESGRQTVIYGIIGIFVMISIWGFVNILDNTFRLSGGGPTSVINWSK